MLMEGEEGEGKRGRGKAVRRMAGEGGEERNRGKGRDVGE